MLKVLLVEDDLDLAAAIIDYLELESIACDHADNGLQGLQLVTQQSYQVVVLDVNLPQLDGIALCEHVRLLGCETPILMLTARDALADKIKGFEAGADDYVVKPFAMEELIARLKALSGRRSGQSKTLKVSDLELSCDNKVVKRNGEQLKISPTSFKILEILMRESPSPVSRERIAQYVWGDNVPDSNSLKVHIFNLRKELDTAGRPGLLKTVTGYGFSLEKEGEPHDLSP